jgi:hypothetical protein
MKAAVRMAGVCERNKAGPLDVARGIQAARGPGDSGFVRNSNEPHVRNPLWQISVNRF